MYSKIIAKDLRLIASRLYRMAVTRLRVTSRSYSKSPKRFIRILKKYAKNKYSKYNEVNKCSKGKHILKRISSGDKYCIPD